MADERLSRLRDHVGRHVSGEVCLRCWAADEIERLRAAGDALCAEYLWLAEDDFVRSRKPMYDWQEARRG